MPMPHGCQRKRVANRLALETSEANTEPELIRGATNAMYCSTKRRHVQRLELSRLESHFSTTCTLISLDTFLPTSVRSA